MATGLLMVLPAIVLALALILWPRSGLELIVRIAARRRPPRPRRALPPGRRRRGAVARGRLLAASLGGRAPPAPALRA